MNEKLTAWLRTTVPGLWAALITWLATLGLPESVAAVLEGGQEFAVAVVLACVYAGLRAAEPYLPPWLDRIVLGSAKPPTYPT